MGWDVLLKVFQFLLGAWQSLPKEKQEEIIESVTDIFKDIFSKQFDESKAKESSNGNA